MAGKSALASRGIIGPIITAVSLVLGALFGVEVDESTQAEIAGQTEVIVNSTMAIVSAAGAVIGLVLGIWGRIKAAKPITSVLPKEISLIKVLAPVLLGLALLATPHRAEAQSACAKTDDMLTMLRKDYGEELVAAGDAKESRLVMTASAAGTFSALVLRQGGAVACLVYSGKNWTGPKPKPGEPA